MFTVNYHANLNRHFVVEITAPPLPKSDAQIDAEAEDLTIRQLMVDREASCPSRE